MENNCSKNFISFAIISLFLTANLNAQQPKDSPNEKTLIIPKVIKVDDVTIKEILKPKGKPLLVNFWATWCVPCREEFPELVEIDNEYKGKIDFITISLDDLAEINRDVPKFLREMKATMPAYLLRTTDENAVISSISKDWAGGLPFTVLYDEKGEIVHTRQGKIKVEIVKEKLSALLTNPKAIGLKESADSSLATVQIKYVCQNETKVWLRLHNLNRWAIAVNTFSMYSFPNKTRKFSDLVKQGSQQIALKEGFSLTTLPNDREIIDLLYFVDEEKYIDDTKFFATKAFGSAGAQSFIAPQDSILFAVSVTNLNERAEVYVKYYYDWEFNGMSTARPIPEHRTTFRGVDLSNSRKTECSTTV